ncbi:MAG TPA: NAD(P)H-binding protein [Galbitalea sp.]|jgi:uncharacterized protein YbjT (DUF2867 family)|nr:NAD(P)H-binding protein [Galbitalea sp.]
MILVTGGTGNIGRELLHELAGRDADTRMLVRDPARASHVPDSIARAIGDLDDPASLGEPFRGVDQLFLLTPGIGTAYASNAVAAAKKSGVRRVVLLSSDNVLGDPMPAMGQWHHEREEILRGSGIPWTILRPTGFMSNALDWLPTLREVGYVLDPMGPGRYAPIDPADIAAVAATVITEDGHDGREYVITGPETLTVGEQVRILEHAIGRKIDVRTVATAEEAVRARFPSGAPPALAAAITEGFALMRADTVGRRTDTVRQLLGREPHDFADWCRLHAEAFASAGW